MRYSFHPEAKKELLEAINYYEEYQSGLGLEFAKEVYSTIQRIIYFPKAWSKLSENTMRCLTGRFPFGVIYQIVEEEVLVIAIMQLNRKPDYWGKRLK
ncbi:MAG: type II toxin-antitoxin system RelE/ParE family toxin [Eubacteriales bacterium]|jgi:hypothetical protein